MSPYLQNEATQFKPHYFDEKRRDDILKTISKKKGKLVKVWVKESSTGRSTILVRYSYIPHWSKHNDDQPTKEYFLFLEASKPQKASFIEYIDFKFLTPNQKTDSWLIHMNDICDFFEFIE